MEISEWLTIIAIIAGPTVVYFLEKRWRRVEWERRRKEKIVQELIGTRAGTRTSLNAKELERALNTIPVLFSDNPDIVEAYNDLHEEINRGSFDPDIATEKLVTLILKVCREMDYEHLEKSSIKKILYFTKE